MSEATTDQLFQLAQRQHHAGRLPEAEKIYRQILALQPDHAGALHLLGVLAKQTGHVDEAIDLIDRAIRLKPRFTDAFINLANIRREKGEFDRAIALCRQAIGFEPQYAPAHCNLGDSLTENGQLDEAIASYQRAIELKPDYVGAFNNLGKVLKDKGQLDEAIAVYQHTIRLKPDLALAHYNLGNVFMAKTQLDPAIAAFQRAIELNPELVTAHFNLGNTFKDKGQLDAAVSAYQSAIRLKPDYADVHNNLGNVLKDRGEIQAAIASFRKSSELSLQDPLSHSNVVYTLYFDTNCGQSELLEEHRRWTRRHADPIKPQRRPHENDRDPNRRLRIGYVSPDFSSHPVGRFILPLLAAHDRSHFEIYCYAFVHSPDAFTPRFKSHADVWRDVLNLSNEQTAELIRKDRIDILVDLTMHLSKNRLPIFACKPAPVQVTYLAYAGTTGLETIDYRITDPHLDPPGMSVDQYTEQSVRLPQSYWCYELPAGDLPITPPPAAKNGFITFGCFNNFCKINPEVLETWGDLLSAVPNSRLILHAHAGSHCDRVVQTFARRGINPERIGFIGTLSLVDYMNQHSRIDIGLDPFPYVGGTTTCDALWMGVPVVTLAGQTAIARGGVSILINIGHAEFIAHSRQQYVQIAADLAGDMARLADLRAGLREEMIRSPLMDAPRFARDMEAAFRGMWKNWCSNR